MYEQLKELLSNATYIYGPTSKEVAFSVPVQSWVTVQNNQWYIGTSLPVEALVNIEVPAPIVEEVVAEPAPDAAV